MSVIPRFGSSASVHIGPCVLACTIAPWVRIRMAACCGAGSALMPNTIELLAKRNLAAQLEVAPDAAQLRPGGRAASLEPKPDGGARPASRDSHACTPCAALAS